MTKQTAHDLEIAQLKLDDANLRGDLKDLEKELKETDRDQEQRLIAVKGFVDSVVITLGTAEDVKEMKKNARDGEVAFTILKWAGGSIGGAVIIALVAWALSGALSGKKADTAPPRANPAMMGPPAPK